MKEVGRVFLLTWKFFTSKIVREFTLMGASSYGEWFYEPISVQCDT